MAGKVKNKLLDEMELMIKSIKINNPGIEERILKAFRVCDRRFFVKQDAYTDVPQHIAHGQTISQPSTVAKMIRVLKLEKHFDVLEIGANTGYHASLVAWLIWPGKVFTIEIFRDLAKMARKNIVKLIRANKKLKLKVKVIGGDALQRKGETWKHKYDRIYFTASVEQSKIEDVKKMARFLLKDKGLLLYPTREAWDYGALELWEKNGKELKLLLRETGYAFVPLLRRQELEELYSKG